MSSATDFAPEDWALLRELPFKVILAAIVADVRGPIGAETKETLVGARRLVKDATTEFSSNELIAGVLADIQSSASDSFEIELRDEDARQAALVEGISLSERAASVLGEHSNRIEADEYKRWVLNAAESVVRATKSGGRFGIGKEDVSKQEREFLDQLTSALEAE